MKPFALYPFPCTLCRRPMSRSLLLCSPLPLPPLPACCCPCTFLSLALPSAPAFSCWPGSTNVAMPRLDSTCAQEGRGAWEVGRAGGEKGSGQRSRAGGGNTITRTTGAGKDEQQVGAASSLARPCAAALHVRSPGKCSGAAAHVVAQPSHAGVAAAACTTLGIALRPRQVVHLTG